MTEADIQAAFFKWARLRENQVPELALLYAIPNGQRRTRWEAATHKRTGMRPGVPDVHLPVGRQNLHGLWMEFKSAKGRISPEQRRWMNDLRAHGHRAEIVRSWTDAANIVMEYLGIDDRI